MPSASATSRTSRRARRFSGGTGSSTQAGRNSARSRMISTAVTGIEAAVHLDQKLDIRSDSIVDGFHQRDREQLLLAGEFIESGCRRGRTLARGNLFR